jgi:hypothetical protein
VIHAHSLMKRSLSTKFRNIQKILYKTSEGSQSKSGQAFSWRIHHRNLLKRELSQQILPFKNAQLNYPRKAHCSLKSILTPIKIVMPACMVSLCNNVAFVMLQPAHVVLAEKVSEGESKLANEDELKRLVDSRCGGSETLGSIIVEGISDIVMKLSHMGGFLFRTEKFDCILQGRIKSAWQSKINMSICCNFIMTPHQNSKS